ncbi:hypothetical protein ACVWXO_006034 [Bradyrhizobium sp. LM2.7]
MLLIADPRLALSPHETFQRQHLQLAAISKAGNFDQG